MDKRGAGWVLVATVLAFAACSFEEMPGSPNGSAPAAGNAGRAGASQGKAGNAQGGRVAKAASGGEGGGAHVGGAPGAVAGADSGDHGGEAHVGGAASGVSGSPTGSAGAGGDAGDGLADSVTFTVVTGQDVRPISPLIYGATVSQLSCNDAKARFTLCRVGDSPWSTYNWENNASNAGVARCFENNAALSESSTPGVAVTDVVDEAMLAGAAAIVTVPMLSHVAADKNQGSAPPACSGDVSQSANYLATRFKQNRPRKGAPLALLPDTTDAFVNQDEFVAFLRSSYADEDVLFSLDHQTELWDEKFKPIHPVKPTYAEIVDLNVAYAKVVKDTWAEANVLGFVGYGFLAARSLQNSPNYLTEGEFIDYVALHYYSEAHLDNVRVINEDTTPGMVAERVQAARSLWDPDYLEGSWINANLGNKPLELIPWLKASVAANYPGTKLGLSEWSFGGGQHISGAIAAADALGIFGREGVELAAAVARGEAPFLLGAFQIFRNFDGANGAFGDTSVYASSSDLDVASVYASVDAADSSRVVIVAINRSTEAVSAAVELTHPNVFSSLKVYRIADGQPEPVAQGTVPAVSSNSFSYDMPGHSVSVLLPSP